MTDDLLGLGSLDFGFDELQQEKAEKEPRGIQKRQKDVTVLEISDKYLYRRAFSETQLLDEFPREMKEGHSLHCMTGGDVDSLSYLRAVMRYQDHLDYLLFSTWCMAEEDVLQFAEWLEQGKIRKMDAYVGEIFPGSYTGVYKLLLNVFHQHRCGRVCVFRNHSKIYAGTGPDFAFSIETSANINTNPRTENGVVTISRELYQFHRDFFDGIKSFDDNGTEIYKQPQET